VADPSTPETLRSETKCVDTELDPLEYISPSKIKLGHTAATGSKDFKRNGNNHASSSSSTSPLHVPAKNSKSFEKSSSVSSGGSVEQPKGSEVHIPDFKVPSEKDGNNANSSQMRPSSKGAIFFLDSPAPFFVKFIHYPFVHRSY
jgi:hypothetical protein